MAAGVRITNDVGTMQFDENYSNLVLVDKQTITISMPTTTAYDYTCAGDVVAVAVRVYPETFITKSAQFTGSAWVYRFLFFNNPDTSGTCTFTVYAFAKPPPTTITRGFKVWNINTRELIFSSQFKPLRIIAVNSNAGGYTGPAGRSLAAMFLSMSLYSVVVFPATVYESDTFRITGNVIQRSRVLIGTPAVAGINTTGLYAAVDVTNY